MPGEVHLAGEPFPRRGPSWPAGSGIRPSAHAQAAHAGAALRGRVPPQRPGDVPGQQQRVRVHPERDRQRHQVIGVDPPLALAERVQDRGQDPPADSAELVRQAPQLQPAGLRQVLDVADHGLAHRADRRSGHGITFLGYEVAPVSTATYLGRTRNRYDEISHLANVRLYLTNNAARYARSRRCSLPRLKLMTTQEVADYLTRPASRPAPARSRPGGARERAPITSGCRAGSATGPRPSGNGSPGGAQERRDRRVTARKAPAPESSTSPEPDCPRMREAAPRPSKTAPQCAPQRECSIQGST